MNNIRPELTPLAVPIDSVSPHPKNARQGDVGAVADSLTEHGQYQPIIVQKKSMRIVAGNHRWKAAKSLGWDKIAAQVLDLTDTQAKKLLLVDNRTSDLATYDDEALLSLLGSLHSLDGTGYTLDDMDELIKSLDTPLSFSLTVEVTFDSHEQVQAWESFRARDPDTFPARLASALEKR